MKRVIHSKLFQILLFFLVFFFGSSVITPVSALTCGETFRSCLDQRNQAACQAGQSGYAYDDECPCQLSSSEGLGGGVLCCGWENPTKTKCSAVQPVSLGTVVSTTNVICLNNITSERALVPIGGNSSLYCCGFLHNGTCYAQQPTCGNTSSLDGQCGAAGGCPPGFQCDHDGLGDECIETTACGGSVRCGQLGTNNGCGPTAGCLDGEQCTVDLEGKPDCALSAIYCGYDEGVSCGDSGTHYVCGAAGGCSSGRYCDQSRRVCLSSNHCNPTTPVRPPPVGGDPTDPNPPDDPDATGGSLDIFAGPNSATFRALNPLAMFKSPYADDFTSPAGVINRALLFVYPLAGLILFVMLVWGGFEILSSTTNSKGMQAGQQRITAALIGFGILFVSFWIIQIVEYIFNIAIL